MADHMLIFDGMYAYARLAYTTLICMTEDERNVQAEMEDNFDDMDLRDDDDAGDEFVSEEVK
jgi:hypothetical protein